MLSSSIQKHPALSSQPRGLRTRSNLFFLVTLPLSILLLADPCRALVHKSRFGNPMASTFQPTSLQAQPDQKLPADSRRIRAPSSFPNTDTNSNELEYPENSIDTTIILGRRQVLWSLAAIAAVLPVAAAEAATDASLMTTTKSLEDLQLGHARWDQLGKSGRSATDSTLSSPTVVPPVFCTYLARFLISFDEGVAAWWTKQENNYSLLSEDQRIAKLGRAFGSFAASLQLSVQSFVDDASQPSDAYAQVLFQLQENYRSDEALRHIGILCALLPRSVQPSSLATKLASTTSSNPTSIGEASPAPIALSEDLSTLLPSNFQTLLLNDNRKSTPYLTIQPPLSTYAVGLDEEFGQVATATTFGPLSSQVLTRELPSYGLNIYALFGISGATGCALTHTVVIPLDVVKTKAQTDPEQYSNIVTGATRILQEEGFQGLLTGAQATLAGYFWYGLSVYPSYTFFKRFMGHTLLPADFSVAHSSDIALIAGALAAVLASLGLTPLEAARIRVVADPGRYKALGLLGTLKVIAGEDAERGWRAVYAGLPSLMTRQVIFGSVKFLAFEKASENIYLVWPSLRDATWTALLVSLVAGGFSGTLSSVVSQPADAVLTYVAQKSESTSKGGGAVLGVWEGCQLMVQESGVSSLFRGLGSRCLWAGSIIAGQFLLYDVFRNYFGVNADDLSQVFRVDL